MADYPGSLPTLPTDSANEDASEVLHPALHNDVNDEVNAIAAELGVTPSGTAPTVADRLDLVESVSPAPRLPVRNDFINPRLASTTNGYGHVEGGTPTGVSFARVSDSDFPGSQAARLQFTHASANVALIQFGVPVATYAVPCAEGVIAFGRCAVKVPAASAGATIALRAIFANSAGTAVQTRVINQPDALPSGVFTLEGFDVAPATSAFVYFDVLISNTSGASELRVGGAQIVANPETAVPRYVDGTTDYSSWLGTADASASIGYTDHPAVAGFRFGANNNSRSGTPEQITVEQEIALLREVGADTLRFGLSPELAQPTSGSAINWRATPYADLFDALIDAQITPLPIIGGVTSWMEASLSIAGLDPSYYDELAALYSALFAEWNLPVVEFLNEANLTDFFGSPISAAKYVDIMAVVHPAIKAVAPSVQFITSGLAHRQVTEVGGDSVADWLAEFYAEGGAAILDAGDTIGIHPYPADQNTAGRATPGTWKAGYDAVMRQVRAAIRAAGDTGRGISITEVGLSSTGADPVVSERQQAQVYELLRGTAERSSDVDMFMFHTLTSPSGTADKGFEVVETPSLRRKPAFFALKNRRITSDLDVQAHTAEPAYGADVYRSTAQSIPNNALTAVDFNQERDDSPAGHHSLSALTSRVVAQKAGRYGVSGQGEFLANATGVRIFYLRHTAIATGTQTLFRAHRSIGSSASSAVGNPSGRIRMAVGDYVELVVFQNSGGALNLDASNPPATLSLDWIGV